MRHLRKQDQAYCLEGVDLLTLTEEFGTPLYVYSRAGIEQAWQEWQQAIALLPPDATSAKDRTVLSYAVKANSNLSILRLLDQLGAGFDVVSDGEIGRVLASGASSESIVFSGVGKTIGELRAACELGIACINLESIFELDLLREAIDGLTLRAPMSIAVRVNPDVDIDTHDYVRTGTDDTKFGLYRDDALAMARAINEHSRLRFAGLVSHIGSQIFEIQAFVRTLEQLLDCAEQLALEGIATPTVGLGGGWGVAYDGAERGQTLTDLGTALAQVLDQRTMPGRMPSLAFEPGRSIVAEAGMLLTRVLGIKQQPGRNFAIVDGAMNDYIRPALYGASNRIINLNNSGGKNHDLRVDVVGPVCESGDFLGRDLKLAAKADDILAVLDSGAYGFSMSSNYNCRPRPAEVLLENGAARLIRERESFADLIASERRYLR